MPFSKLPRPLPALSRRDFLKLSGIGLLSLGMWQIAAELPAVRAGWLADLLPPLADFRSLNPDQQGRVLEANIAVYDIPSFTGNKVKIYWRDTILPITDVTLGDETPIHNRVWYRLGDKGFAHSGVIQPVKTITNPVVTEIPETGILAEVTVPFTDARWLPGKDQFFAYRFYYETTHWVTGLTVDALGDAWYEILDDKWKYRFYAPASHFHLYNPDELTPLSPDIPEQDKRIEVRTAEQVVIAYEHDIPVYMARTATGAQFRDGNYATPPGHYMTFYKRPYRHMAAGDLASNGYDLPGVPWICYFIEDGIAVHGTYWHNDFGKPRSHGCVNLTPQAAKWVYRWSLPVVPALEQELFETTGTVLDVI